MLLHVFDYSSVSEMPVVPLTYIVLSPILVACVIACYLYPMWISFAWDFVLASFSRTLDGSTGEQSPLLGKHDISADA